MYVERQGWYNVCWRVSCYFPGVVLGVLSVLNLAIWHTGSSGAIPLGAFFSLVSLWFIVSTPLCYSGAPPAPPPLATARCSRPAALSQSLLLLPVAAVRWGFSSFCATWTWYPGPAVVSGLEDLFNLRAGVAIATTLTSLVKQDGECS